MMQSHRKSSVIFIIFTLLASFLRASDSFFVKSSTRTTPTRLFSLDDIEYAASEILKEGQHSEDVIRAAASVTQDSIQNLGIKSVGVDYGLSRTGIAATVGFDPEPLCILSGLNSTETCEKVIEISRGEQAKQIVVGLPLHKNGTEAEQTAITRTFAVELAGYAVKAFGPNFPVFLWDERYTSKEAAARAHSRDPNRYLYGTLDAEAACIILENFYADNGSAAAERVRIPEDLASKYSQLWQENIEEDRKRLQAAKEDRDANLRWRKEAMKRDRELAIEATKSLSLDSNKKKKKKKKKRKK